MPCCIGKTIAIESSAAPDGLQQVGEIEFHVGRFPELDDILKHMWKFLIEHLRVLIWAAFQRMQNDFSIDHDILQCHLIAFRLRTNRANQLCELVDQCHAGWFRNKIAADSKR
jgi:hypothetical protein